MLSSLWAWLRRHPRVVDSVYAALFLLPNLPYIYIDTYPVGQPMGGRAVATVLVVSLCVPLVWRRKWPVATFAAIASVAFVQWALDHFVTFADFALLLAAYTVAAQSRRLYTVLAFLVLELGALLVVLRWIVTTGGDWRPSFLLMSFLVLTTMLFGDSVRSRRAYYAELEARAQRLEHEREQESQLAVAAERARIAREMHDVVAHNVSVMVVQAEGAAYLMDVDTERSRAAVETVAATGRQALAEMRRLLGVLRSDQDDADERTPQPGLVDVPDLVARVRDAGLPVELDMTQGAAVGAGQGLAAYRVVQEALTNVLKHAGPQARATVRVERDRDLVRLTVADDGRGAAADVSEGPGHGLRGMRERVGVYGGSLRAGPRPGGGFEVHAEIPATAERS